jgi:hypothetical protein
MMAKANSQGEKPKDPSQSQESNHVAAGSTQAPENTSAGVDAAKKAENAATEVHELPVVMNEESATEILNQGEPEEGPAALTMSTLGAYKANRLKYDLANIVGGKIVAVVSALEMGGTMDKLGLVVEVETPQRETAKFVVWPVADLKTAMASITDFEINKAE